MKAPLFFAGLFGIGIVAVLAELMANPLGTSDPLMLFPWLSLWWLFLASLHAAARQRKLGQAFWLLPSTWLALSPLMQFYLPLVFHYFGWLTISNDAVFARLDDAIGPWTISTIFIAMGSAFVEPRAALKSGLLEAPKLVTSLRGQLRLFGVAAIILLGAGIAARLAMGGFSISEVQTTRRVFGENTDQNTRITMLIVPFLTLSTCLCALRYSIIYRAGLPTRWAGLVFGFALLVTVSYQILLGSRGGVLYTLAPSMLIMLFFAQRRERTRLALKLGFTLVGLLYVADMAREFTLVIGSQLAKGVVSPVDLLNAYLHALDAGGNSPSEVSQNKNALEEFIGRMGTGWILTNLLDSPSFFGELKFWSFLRVYSVSLPTSLSPWDQFIPYPTDQPIHDLGYLAGYLINGFEGAGLAVPPPAEIFWRFGAWGMPVASLIWGISLGLVLRLWVRVSPVLGLFFCGYFALPLMLAETSWVLFANIVRQPLMLLAALQIARFLTLRSAVPPSSAIPVQGAHK